MDNPPSLVRRTLYERLYSKQFNFPHAAARLVATVYEPRTDDVEYPEETISELKTVRHAIQEKLHAELADSERSSIGSIEKYCLDRLAELITSDAVKDHNDITRRLHKARELSKGNMTPVSESHSTYSSPPSLPDPITTRSDRPPFGRWR